MSMRLFRSVTGLVRAQSALRSFSSLGRKSLLQPAVLELRPSPTFMMSQSFSSNPNIATYEEIKNLPKKPETLLIDVREPAELAATGVVPTSINIPLGQVVATLSPEFPPKEFEKMYNRKKPSADTEIIFMCKIGKRSQRALDMSKALGYTNMKNFLGSWDEWEAKEGLTK